MAGNLVRRRGLFTGGARAGGGVNYTDFDSTGYMTAASTGRVLKEIVIPATQWHIGPAGSAFALSSSVYNNVGGQHYRIPTISPSSATCNPVFEALITAPLDAATSGSVLPFVEMIINTATSTASNMQFTLKYNYINNGASTTTSGSVTATISALTGVIGAGNRVSGSLTNMASFAAGGQMVVLQLTMLTGVGTAGASYDFAALRLRYMADRLGTQSS